MDSASANGERGNPGAAPPVDRAAGPSRGRPRRPRRRVGRAPLNPCDYHFLALQSTGLGRSDCPFTAVWRLDLGGRIPPDAMRAGLVRWLRRMPVLAGRLRFSLVWGRPYWQYDVPADDAAVALHRGDVRDRGGLPDVAATLYEHHDLSGDGTFEAESSRILEAECARIWRLDRGPLARVVHLSGPDRGDRLFLFWPHALMDAGAGLACLAELSRFIAPSDGRPAREVAAAAATPGLPSDPRAADPLRGRPLRNRFMLALRGWRDHRRTSNIKFTRWTDGAPRDLSRTRILSSMGGAESWAQAADAARRRTPDGPARYARHLAGAVLAALRRLYLSRGVDSPAYSVAFPMRALGRDARPPLGNHLVAPQITVTSDAIESGRLGEAVAACLEDFTRNDGVLRQWALQWVASASRWWIYRRLARVELNTTPIQSGFAYFDAGWEPSIENFAGVPLLRAGGGGIGSMPPGWNAIFCRYRERLTLSLSWIDGVYEESTAREFAALIEEEATRP